MADVQSNIDIRIDTSSALASIKLLQAQISAFHTSMAKGTAENVVASRQLQQRLIDSINATQKFSAGIQTIKTTTESFTTALEKNKLSLGQYFKYSVAATKSFGGAFKTEMSTIDKVARERVKDLQTQYIQLGRDANGAMKAIAVRPLVLDLENMQTKTALVAQKQQILNQLLKQGSTNLLNFGKNTQWAGRQLMVGFTIPLSMAATAAAKAYMDIEKASIAIARVYGDLNTSNKEVTTMVAQIKQLAGEYTKYGIAIADTMQMASKAAAMGKTGSDLLAQVNQASKLSALGMVDQQMALDTTISLTNAFGTATEQLASKIDFLNAVENQTVLSIEDMTVAIPKAAPIVKQLGGDVEDLAFFLTAMKEGGINASEGANALKSGLSSLINPTKASSEFLAGFGVNVKKIVEDDKGNLKKTVVDFASALDKIDPLNRARAIEMMFGKFQFSRISALLQNVNKEGSQASKALELANMSSIQLAAISRKELDKLQSSPAYKFEKAIADLQLKIAPIGETFLKAVTPIIEKVSDFLSGFNKMGDGFKQFVVVGAAVLGGLAPVLLMVVGLVANGAANIIKLFANVKAFLNKTTTESQVLGETTNYLTTEQIKAEAVAASLDQTHTKLRQTFTSETSAIIALMEAYQGANAAMAGMRVPAVPTSIGKGKKFASGGIISGPGTGTSDSIPAMVSNGEAIIPAKNVARFPGLVNGLVSGNIPGFAEGTEKIGRGFLNFRTYTDATALLSKGANSALNIGKANPSQIASEFSNNPEAIQGPLIAALAESLGGAKTQTQIRKFLKSNPQILAYAKDLSLGIADEVSAITAKTMGDPQFYNAVNKARKKIKTTPEIKNAVSTIFSQPTTYEEDTIERQRSSGRFMALGRERLTSLRGRFSGIAQRGRSLARGLYGNVLPEDSVFAHMIAPKDMSMQDIESSGLPLSKQAINAMSRKKAGIKTISVNGKTVQVPFDATPEQKRNAIANTFNDTLASEAQTASESKRTRKIAKDTTDGYANELERGKKKVVATAKKTTQAESDYILRNLQIRKQQAQGIGAETASIDKEIAARRQLLAAQKENVVAQTREALQYSAPIGPVQQKASLGSRIGAKISGMGTGGMLGLAMGASVAASALSMIPGPVGQTVGSFMPLINGISMLLPVLTMLPAGVMTALAPFAPWILGIGAVVAGTTFLISQANEARKKEIEKINASSNAYTSAKKSMSALDAVGIKTKKSGLDVAVGALSGQTAKTANDVQTLLEAPEFQKGGALAKLSGDFGKIQSPKERTAFLTSYATMLSGKGVADNEINALIAAIQQKAGKTDLVFNFKNMKIGTVGGNRAIASSLATYNKEIEDAQKAYDQKYKTEITDKEKAGGFTGEGGARAKQMAIDALKGSKEALALEAKRSAQGKNTVSILQGISDAYLNGSISQKKYTSGMDLVIKKTGIFKNQAAGIGILKSMFATMDPAIQAVANQLNSAKTQAQYLQLALLGVGLAQQEIRLLNANELGGYTGGTSGVLTPEEQKKAGTLFADKLKKAKKDWEELQKALGSDTSGASGGTKSDPYGDFFKGIEAKQKSVAAELAIRKDLLATGMDIADAEKLAADSAAQAAYMAAKTKDEKDAVIRGLRIQLGLEKQLMTIEQKKAEADKKAVDAQQKKIDKRKAQLGMALQQAQITQYNDALNVLGMQENDINKVYDERATALEKIQKTQEAIAAAQKDQLSVADALSKGDIAAAARAVQEARANSAQRSMDNQKDNLEKSKQAQLEALTVSVNGKLMTRKQIEQQIETIQKNIYTLQLNEISAMEVRLAQLQETSTLSTIAAEESATPQTAPGTDFTQKTAIAPSAAAKKAYANAIKNSSSKNKDVKAKALASVKWFENKYMSMGGIVPNYMAMGGFAKGTDIIPAMLTPGEFVVSQPAVKNFGVDNLRAINNGTSIGDSVYNYSLSVNMSGSNLNPNDVARAVMSQIRQVDAQRIRGNTF